MKKKQTITLEELKEVLTERGYRISRAKRVKSLLQKRKGFLKDKQHLTDFKEPAFDLYRRDGRIETYEDATAGVFVFEHSDGTPRFIELRPEDRCTRDYGGKKVPWYIGNEDRPATGWDNPIVDSESVKIGYEKTKATDLKYQERIERLKAQGKKSWLYVGAAIALVIGVGAFAYNTWIAPSMAANAKEAAKIAAPPAAGIIFMRVKNVFRKDL